MKDKDVPVDMDMSMSMKLIVEACGLLYTPRSVMARLLTSFSALKRQRQRQSFENFLRLSIVVAVGEHQCHELFVVESEMVDEAGCIRGIRGIRGIRTMCGHDLTLASLSDVPNLSEFDDFGRMAASLAPLVHLLGTADVTRATLLRTCASRASLERGADADADADADAIARRWSELSVDAVFNARNTACVVEAIKGGGPRRFVRVRHRHPIRDPDYRTADCLWLCSRYKLCNRCGIFGHSQRVCRLKPSFEIQQACEERARMRN